MEWIPMMNRELSEVRREKTLSHNQGHERYIKNKVATPSTTTIPVVATTEYNTNMPSLHMVWPCSKDAVIGLGFGEGGEGHRGIDIIDAYGSPIYAVADGVVRTVSLDSWGGGYGLYVIIDHGNGLFTLYSHCSKILVSNGQPVTMGDQIAGMGSSGDTTGNLLHFEVRLNSVPQDPLSYL